MVPGDVESGTKSSVICAIYRRCLGYRLDDDSRMSPRGPSLPYPRGGVAGVAQANYGRRHPGPDDGEVWLNSRPV